MRLVIQRVSEASVTINESVASSIGHGLMVLVGIEEADNQEDIDWLIRKVLHMRVFPDEEGVMNQSLHDIGGELLIVSQFTLHASTKKGNRPSYMKAARPETAITIYEKFVATAEKEFGKSVATGTFGADMKVALINDGPVTIQMDSKNRE